MRARPGQHGPQSADSSSVVPPSPHSRIHPSLHSTIPPPPDAEYVASTPASASRQSRRSCACTRGGRALALDWHPSLEASYVGRGHAPRAHGLSRIHPQSTAFLVRALVPYMRFMRAIHADSRLAYESRDRANPMRSLPLSDLFNRTRRTQLHRCASDVRLARRAAAVGGTHGHTRTPALTCGLRVLVYFKLGRNSHSGASLLLLSTSLMLAKASSATRCPSSRRTSSPSWLLVDSAANMLVPGVS
ncbi:hypothetical protein B0H17DRAFT_160251 [Mycena rosella]|uniref:Uncharacterized protein n=1 Tax=Mycena rosella TaxID=1033263 RepID=A0AAD7D551_MYCRO|nr:hypothetical protein B0H17DRAFT_160251 [Mycena rosella]